MNQPATLSLAAMLAMGTATSALGQPSLSADSSDLPKKGGPSGATQLTYPTARKSDQVDVYHGVRVADPYRWLEDSDSPETRQWIAEQNALATKFLEGIPQREALRKRLLELWNYEKYDTPIKRGNRYFYAFNSGLQNQSVLYVQEGRTGTARILLDPNTLAVDGTVALNSRVPSSKGQYLAYGVSIAGSDWVEVRVRDVTSGKDLADTVRWIKFSVPSWTKDEAGFVYARYDQPSQDKALSQIVRNQKVYYHKIGTPQSSDQLVYERPDRPDWIWAADISDDGRYLILTASQGSDPKTRMFYMDLQDPQNPNLRGKVVEILGAGDAQYSFIGNIGDIFYIRTNKDAPKGRIIAVDVKDPSMEKWVTVVPEGDEVLTGARFLAGRLFTVVLKDAHSAVYSYTVPALQEGNTGASPVQLGERTEIQLPGLGSLAGLSGSLHDSEVFYGFMSYLTPTTIYEYDVKSGTSTVFRAPKLAFDPSRYETRQVFYTSKDGTRVPMFITMKKGTVLDGKNPTLLYGYGGFNISLTPAFHPRTLVWLENGGIYAVANLRGGGEYGSAWHRAGTLHQKQNVFDDFIAAAEYLIAEKYTSTPKLAINGGSNGGLLVGAVVNQRPELFGAAVPEVGVMDMLRFQKFTIGWAWTSDYGSSDDSTQFATLYKYSPIHNIKPGIHYPATLVMTADHDDRVVPGHSFKYAATLQAAQGGVAPILIRIETKAGHGAGKPTSKQIEEAADRFGFLMWALGM
jgi:prolyl oligopeptidase